MIWIWVVLSVLQVCLIIGNFYAAHRHRTYVLEVLRMEARHAAEREALKEWERAVRRELTRFSPPTPPWPPCKCLNGCKSPTCDK